MPARLRCRRDGTFTLVQFTDTHLENGEPEDHQTTALMERVLDLEQPDLVLCSGDVLGPACHDAQSAWARAAMPMISRGLPWAAVFGNHDDEGGSASRQELLAMQQRMPGCLTRPGPKTISGLGNFQLPVDNAEGTQTMAVLYCLDSNSYAGHGLPGHGWVGEDQIQWFKRGMKKIRQQAEHAVPQVLVFQHIPLPEYDEVWRLGGCIGKKNEAVCCPPLNTGFFAALCLTGLVKGVFCGHDHVNDYEGRLHGIRLCYGRASGYNTYGREGFARGARIIRLHADGRDFETWLRLEDGRRITQSPQEGAGQAV